MRVYPYLFILVIIIGSVCACSGQPAGDLSSSSTSTPPSTPKPAPTSTPSPTSTPTPTNTLSSTFTPTSTATPTPDLKATAEAYGWSAVEHENQGEYEQAIADYTQAIELDPEYATA